MTNADDLRAACKAGADALGINFVPSSPRYVGGDAEAARKLLDATPPFVWRVGVFDGLPARSDLTARLHGVQYYANDRETDVFHADARPTPIAIKAFRIRDESSLDQIARDAGPRDVILLDAYAPNALGGTGHTFNWELALEAKRRFGLPIALAGGLTPENVGDAVAAVRPFMVDVASGVESSPGRKDHDKMRRFIREVRLASERG